MKHWRTSKKNLAYRQRILPLGSTLVSFYKGKKLKETRIQKPFFKRLPMLMSEGIWNRPMGRYLQWLHVVQIQYSVGELSVQAPIRISRVAIKCIKRRQFSLPQNETLAVGFCSLNEGISSFLGIVSCLS